MQFNTLVEKTLRDCQLNTIEEGVLSSLGHTTLNIASFIPGVGSVADVTNAVWYASEGDFLFAAFSLISCIPVIGHIIGTGGRLTAGVSRALTAGTNMVSNSVKGLIDKLKGLIQLNVIPINALMSTASKNLKLQPYIKQMSQALQEFSGVAVTKT